MNPEWQTLLRQAGACFVGDDVENFGNLQQELLSARDTTVVAPLSHLGLIRVSGADADEFVHNLTSNDVKNLPLDAAEFNSLNNAKGRMLASLLTWRDDGDLVLMLSRDLQAGVQKKLAMYVLRSKVKLADATNLQTLLGVAGPGAADLLTSLCGEVPAKDLALTRFAGGTVIRLSASPLAPPRFLLALHPAQAPELWQALSAAARPVGSTAWRWLDIRAGWPRVGLATQEHFVPQMINFDVLGGLSFTKGCYPGQEVVARTRYLGKIKRRMFLAHATLCPPPGTAIFAPSTGEQACGNVVDAVPSPEGGFDMLAVIQTPCVEAGPVHLSSLEGATLDILSLPYSLPE